MADESEGVVLDIDHWALGRLFSRFVKDGQGRKETKRVPRTNSLGETMAGVYGVHAEPCERGGVTLIGCSGNGATFWHDKKGYVRHGGQIMV